MKESYVYREDGDTFATLIEKLNVAASKVGVGLSEKKRRLLLGELTKNGVAIVCDIEPKVFKRLSSTSITIPDSTQIRLNAKKFDKGFNTYDEVIIDCLDKVDAIEKMIDKCAGDETDCGILYESLYDLFYGDKK